MRSGPRRAFTLIEILLALVLIVALGAAIYSFTANLAARRARTERTAETLRGPGRLFDMLSDDLAAAIAASPAAGSGVKGSATDLVVLSRALAADASTDLRRSHYALSAADRTFTAQRGRANGPDPDPAVLARGIERVQFRYHDGKTWADTFDSQAVGALPGLIEVSVWVASDSPAKASEPAATPVSSDTETQAPPSRPADRLRLIRVPDGPASAWKEGTP